MTNCSSKPTEKELYCYDTYLALKIHFNTPSYDFFKFKGRIKNRPNEDHQKSKYTARRLAKTKNKLELIEFIFANLLHDKRFWLGEATSDHEEIYQDWKKRQDSLTYRFKSDLNKIFSENRPFNAYFRPTEDNHIITLLMQNEISLESVVILDVILGFLPSWKKYYAKDIYIPDVLLRIEKAEEFLVRYHELKDDKLRLFKKMLKERAEASLNVLPF